MKKTTAVLLSISLLLVFAGCMKQPPAPTNEPTIVPTIPAATDTVPTEATLSTQPPVTFDGPLLAFSAPLVSEEYRAADGSLVFTYTYQDISLILEDPQIADAVVIDYLNLIDYENSSAKHTLSDAKEAYTGGTDWIPYSFSMLFSPVRFDAGILSLYGTQVLYNGNIRPTTADTAVNYDLLSGRQLELKDVLVDGFSADTLCELICDALQEMENQGMLYSDYAYVISELFSTNRPVETWYFSDNGLCFFFAPYEIAPYSAGTIIAEIPYAELTDLLKEAYFPEEKIDLSGAVYLELFQDAELSQVAQFAELVIDETGSKYLLRTDGCLQNVRIEIGSQLEGEDFLVDTTVFAALTLCSSDGLMIQFPLDMPQSLRLSYEDNGQPVSLDLTSLISAN